MTKENSHNFLKLALKESENYLSMEKMISALESKTDLQYLPLQPLYLAYTNLSLEKKTATFPGLLFFCLILLSAFKEGEPTPEETYLSPLWPQNIKELLAFSSGTSLLSFFVLENVFLDCFCFVLLLSLH